MNDPRMTIAIVGAGPRGLSVLERICANVPEIATGRTVEVHLVDPYPAGAGKVWRSEQSHHLLMNTVSSQVTVFTDSSVDCAGPVVAGPSLFEWARSIALIGDLDDEDSGTIEEARRLGPNSYSSRAFYGRYLRWALRRIVATAPSTVSICVHAAVAVKLQDSPDGSQVLTLANGVRLTSVDAVILAQGHLPQRITKAERSLSSYALDHGLRYVPPSNPSDVDLTGIAPGDTVVLRGLGLNFFDYMALLTHGRGGRFERVDGRLAYRPSGHEPVLVAGSRRGVPYHSRGANQKGADGRHVPMLLTDDVIENMRTRARRNNDVDFKRDVWPLISIEVESVYYSTLLSRKWCSCRAGQFLDGYLAAGTDSREKERLLGRFDIASSQRWSWDMIERPYGNRRFTSHEEYRKWLVDYLRDDVREAEQGNVDGPLKAALDTLRDLRNEVRLVVDHAGITGQSYRDQLQGWYTQLNAFVSVGPPAQRIEEMIALIESGVLTVVGPRMTVTVRDDPGGFIAASAAVPGETWEGTTLIEARLPEIDVRNTTDPLVRQLIDRGEAQPYRIPDPVAGPVEFGGLAVTPRPYRIIGRDGRPHPRRFSYGVPTETVHWVTAAGARPGVNSVTLSDSDAIARAALSVTSPVVGVNAN